jgi:hypothetical protein
MEKKGLSSQTEIMKANHGDTAARKKKQELISPLEINHTDIASRNGLLEVITCTKTSGYFCIKQLEL